MNSNARLISKLRILFFLLLSEDNISLMASCVEKNRFAAMCVGRSEIFRSFGDQSWFQHYHIFSRGHATLHLAVSVGRSVGRYVRNISKIASGFRITAPAQPSATGLPCIRLCWYMSLGLKDQPKNSWSRQACRQTDGLSQTLKKRCKDASNKAGYTAIQSRTVGQEQ